MLKELGYDGVGHIWLDGVAERLKTLDDAGLKLYQITMWVDLTAGQARLRTALQGGARPSEGPSCPVRLLILNGMKPSDPAGDDRAVKILREMSDLARDSGSKLLLYPHTSNWIERIEDAVRVADQVDRPNVGVMFNLCHWLRVDPSRDYRSLLARAMPRLWAVSINGADVHDDESRLGPLHPAPGSGLLRRRWPAHDARRTGLQGPDRPPVLRHHRRRPRPPSPLDCGVAEDEEMRQMP